MIDLSFKKKEKNLKVGMQVMHKTWHKLYRISWVATNFKRIWLFTLMSYCDTSLQFMSATLQSQHNRWQHIFLKIENLAEIYFNSVSALTIYKVVKKVLRYFQFNNLKKSCFSHIFLYFTNSQVFMR